MNIKIIDDNISVSPQISPADVEQLARLGFKTIVANRPDGEEPGQPAMADLEAAANTNNLAWYYLPVESGNITDLDIDNFAAMFHESDKPILAFCRSGTRCTVLWALTSARDEPVNELAAKAQRAGYDIAGLAPRMAQQASRKN